MPRPGGPSGWANFDPRQIPGCAAWWCPDDLPASGAVASWTDRVGGYVLTQATSSRQGVIDAINGHRALLCDGTDDFYSAGDVLDLGTRSLAVFMALDIRSLSSGVAGMLSKANTGGNPVGAWFATPRADAPLGYEMLYRSSAALQYAGHTTVTATGAQLYAAVLDRPAGVFRIWDKDGTKYTSAGWTPKSEDLNTAVNLLLHGYNGSHWGGIQAYGDVVVYLRPTALTDAEVDAVRTWLRGRYGL